MKYELAIIKTKEDMKASLDEMKNFIASYNDEHIVFEYFKYEPAIQVIENYIKQEQLILYGGAALHHLFGEKFYEKYEIYDYDCLSSRAKHHMDHLKSILDKQYEDVKVKTAINKGTYRLYIGTQQILDITAVSEPIELGINTVIKRDQEVTRTKAKIKGKTQTEFNIAPLYLLMANIHTELANPMSITRWRKNYVRLLKIMSSPLVDKLFKNTSNAPTIETTECQSTFTSSFPNADRIIMKLASVLQKKFVLVGHFALKLWLQHIHSFHSVHIDPDIMVMCMKDFNTEYVFDILSTNPLEDIDRIKNELNLDPAKYEVTVLKRWWLSKQVPKRYNLVIVDKETKTKMCLLRIYGIERCYNYMHIGSYRVGSIDTCLAFFYNMKFVYEVYERVYQYKIPPTDAYIRLMLMVMVVSMKHMPLNQRAMLNCASSKATPNENNGKHVGRFLADERRSTWVSVEKKGKAKGKK